jgi:NADH dehydrogenase FAD-containing subunit
LTKSATVGATGVGVTGAGVTGVGSLFELQAPINRAARKLRNKIYCFIILKLI